MADQESLAAANHPVAAQPTPQPVPSLYDGLRVKLAEGANLAATLVGGGITPAKQVENAEAVGQEVKETATNPKKRTNFLTGMVSGPGEEGELGEEAAKLYEGLRVRKADTPEPTAAPTRVYHGATQEFDDFKTPAYFSTERDVAQRFAETRAKHAGEENPKPRIVTADVHFKNPVVIDAQGDFAGNLQFGLKSDDYRAALKDTKSDGIILKNTKDEGDVYIAKDASRIKQIKEPTKLAANASGESAASQEGINRAAAEKSQGLQRVKIDTRSGKETPLHGVDAVDIRPQPHEVIVQRGPKGETLLDKGEKARYTPKKFEQSQTDSMNDPDTRFAAARHESGHAVVAENQEPGSVEGMALGSRGGVTDVTPAAGKTKISDLSHDDVKNFIATSLAGGLSEPGGTTPKHASGDRDARAQIIGALSSSPVQNLERLMTGKALGDEMAKGSSTLAEGRARAGAILADPRTQKAIDTLAAEFNEKGKLSGTQVRKVLDKLK
jgi:hypothetical protein